MQVSPQVKLFSGCKPGGTEHPEQEKKKIATIFQLKHSASIAHMHLQPVTGVTSGHCLIQWVVNQKSWEPLH